MIVRCQQIINPITGERDRTSPHLTVGRDYRVLEVHARPHRAVTFRLLGDDHGSPSLWDSQLFSAEGAELPASWVASIKEGGVVTIGPPEWQRHGFWDDYFDDEPAAVRDFDRVVEAFGDR